MNMGNLEYWDEKTRGLYRWVIAAKCCYEIHIMRHDTDVDIQKAQAQIYIVGDWYNQKLKESYFERELLFAGSVQECLEHAVKDNEKNN